MNTFTEAARYEFGTETRYAPTSDPRVIALIFRDQELQALDGDGYAPAYWTMRDHDLEANPADSPAGHTFRDEHSDEIASKLGEAVRRFRYAAGYRYNGLSYEMISKARRMMERWLWVFHQTTLESASHGGYEVTILNTPEWRAHVGLPEIPASLPYWEAETLAHDALLEERAEWNRYLEGDAWGIGYATNEAHVLHADETPDPTATDGWEIESTCWGYLGRDYAEREALDEAPREARLPEMLYIPTEEKATA